MKICTYCNSRNDDHARSCEKCGAVELINICNNCQTAFSSGFCPTCGIRAGEIAKTCLNCGNQSFGTFCPVCGFNLGANATAEGRSYTSSSTTYATQTSQKPMADNHQPQSNGKMIVLTLFFLPICSWIILFSPKYNRKMRIFVIVFSAVMIVEMLILISIVFRDPAMSAGLMGMIYTLFLLIAPLIAYAIKFLSVRMKEKKQRSWVND